MSKPRQAAEPDNGLTTDTITSGRAALTPAEVADLLGMSRQWVYILLDRRELVGFHIGRKRRVTVASVAAYVDRQVAAEQRLRPRRRPA